MLLVSYGILQPGVLYSFTYLRFELNWANMKGCPGGNDWDKVYDILLKM